MLRDTTRRWGLVARWGARPLAALALLLVAVAASAQDVAVEPIAPRDALERDTPRGSMVGYLTAARERDFERAAEYLDLRRLPPEERTSRGAELARQLKVVLDRTLWVEPELLSADPIGRSDDDLARSLDRVGVVQSHGNPVDILVQRIDPRDGPRIWKVASQTVARIPMLYDEYGYGPLEQYLPQVFFDVQALDVALWQWCALLVIVVAAWMLSYLLGWAVSRVLRSIVARTETLIDDDLAEGTKGPLRLFLGVSAFTAGTSILGLALPVHEFFQALEKAAIVVALAWLAMRVVDVLGHAVERRLEEQGQRTAVPLVTPGRRAVKIALGLLAFVAMLDNFGFNVAALLAGLGVGGIAVALAAQKTIENLFGGIMLYADRPVRVGEFCKWSGQVGTVEEIGMRSTRIRTLDRSVVSIPNAEFASMQIENYTRRDFIRLFAVLGLRYETTPEQMRSFLVKVRHLLYSHEKVTNDPARIRFIGFGAYSLDFEIFAYTKTADWNEFLGIREDVFLRIMDIVDECGTGFAFPSSTVYVGRDEGLDLERARATEAELQALREKREVYLPDFPPERIREIDDTLIYPPEGSPARREG